MKHQGRTHQSQNQSGAKFFARILSLIEDIKRNTDRKTSDDNDTNADNHAIRRYTFWLMIATVVIAGAGLLTFGASLLQWAALQSTDLSIGSQLTVMQNQLAEQKADRRPWLIFNGDISTTQSLLFNVKGANFSFAGRIKNSGKSMAKNVKTFLAPMVAPIPGVKNGEQQSAAEYKKSVVEAKLKVCDPTNVSEWSVLGGKVLMAGDDFPFDSGPLTVPTAGFAPNQVPKGEVSAWTYFCIAYEDDARKPEPHGTDFILAYEGKNPKRSSFVPAYGEIPGTFEILGVSLEMH